MAPAIGFHGGDAASQRGDLPAWVAEGAESTG
jgi:hypothetical protein